MVKRATPPHNGPMEKCAICDDDVRPNDPDVVYAVRGLRVQSMRGATHQVALAAYFRESCYPRGSSDYAVRPNPGEA